MSRAPFSRGLNLRDLNLSDLKFNDRPDAYRSDSLTQLPLPPELNIQLETSVEPGVKAGDQVVKGDVIATPKTKESCCVLAPASGSITFADQKQIRIATSQTDVAQTKDLLIPDSADKLIHLLRASAIKGLGGGGFPAHQKLSGDINTLIINGVECEPYLCCDYYLMTAHLQELVKTISFLKNILNIDRCIVALKESQTALLGKFSVAASNEPCDLEILTVPDIYPAGSEKFLVYQLTGNHLSAQEHPSDKGIVCQNIGTLFSIYQAVFLREPQLSRILTLFDGTSSTLINLEVLFGTAISFILETLDLERKGLNSKASQLIVGGLLSGKKLDLQAAEHTYVSAETNSIFLGTGSIGRETEVATKESPCIRCGKCADVCAANLLPQQLLWNLQQPDRLDELRLADCLECGACDFVCPSSIPITSRLIAAKGRARQEVHQKKLAEETRLRFERHLQRTKTTHFSDQLKLKEDRETLSKNDVIAAALSRKKEQGKEHEKEQEKEQEKN